MVTRSYLEGWANENRRLLVWDLENKSRRELGLNDATVVKYAYKTEHFDVDLERKYSAIESDGISAIRTLTESGTINNHGRSAIANFIEMHRERGLYADQTKVRMPVIFGGPGGIRPETMGLGDRLALRDSVDTGIAKLKNLELRRWRWRVHETEWSIITGDGAVLLWRDYPDSPISTVTFPLSPNKLLMIGAEFNENDFPINQCIADNCRRWIIEELSNTCRAQRPLSKLA